MVMSFTYFISIHTKKNHIWWQINSILIVNKPYQNGQPFSINTYTQHVTIEQLKLKIDFGKFIQIDIYIELQSFEDFTWNQYILEITLFLFKQYRKYSITKQSISCSIETRLSDIFYRSGNKLFNHIKKLAWIDPYSPFIIHHSNAFWFHIHFTCFFS